ncbi:uncharacterized protein LOC134198323 isoform X2 [Corticium candelabrum]|uniref:uncharacterized protein LOC134198323 isoform X2 n=1 Tax=Corticium candelabrum TaxID=121492 RepID=UPI002E258750|nr:uncharacterized protein LOC134198323 isoform X2 [Corticium candelabrum]
MRRSVRTNPWLSLSRHFGYVADRLRLDAALLRRLVEVGMMSGDEYDELTNECFLKRKRMKRLLRDILSRQDPTLFDTFCKIVSEVGQGFIVEKLKEGPHEIVKSAAYGKKTEESHTTAAASCGTAPTARGSPEYVMSTSRDFPAMETSGRGRETPTVFTERVSVNPSSAHASAVRLESAQAHSSRVYEKESWPAIRKNYRFLSHRLRLSAEFLGCLYEQSFINKDDLDAFHSISLPRDRKLRLLLVDILPTRPPSMFTTFCNILRHLGQPHVAERLERYETDRLDCVEGSRRSQEKEETLTSRVARLEREKTAERKQTEAANARADAAEARADAAESKAKKEVAEKKEGKWTILALRCDKAEHAERVDINDSLPSWTQWNVHMPHDCLFPYNRMGEIEGRLVVGCLDGNLHVLTYEHDKWDKFVRKNGHIKNVVCHQGVCLVCVEDGDKDQLVIEQFYLNEDKKWRFLTVLPNELQLYGVSVALHDNSLYVVGGRTKSGERVNTARVCDLHSGHWYKMDDMQTKRSDCSSVIINNTVFVGGGKTDRRYSSNIVECADVCDRKWRTIPSTTTYRPTLTSVSNRLVGTGGDTQQQWLYSPSSNIVELYDERSTKWLPLPLMTHKREEHAAFSTQNGELITAGGFDEDSIESLKCD